MDILNFLINFKLFKKYVLSIIYLKMEKMIFLNEYIKNTKNVDNNFVDYKSYFIFVK